MFLWLTYEFCLLRVFAKLRFWRHVFLLLFFSAFSVWLCITLDTVIGVYVLVIISSLDVCVVALDESLIYFFVTLAVNVPSDHFCSFFATPSGRNWNQGNCATLCVPDSCCFRGQGDNNHNNWGLVLLTSSCGSFSGHNSKAQHLTICLIGSSNARNSNPALWLAEVVMPCHALNN